MHENQKAHLHLYLSRVMATMNRTNASMANPKAQMKKSNALPI